VTSRVITICLPEHVIHSVMLEFPVVGDNYDGATVIDAFELGAIVKKALVEEGVAYVEGKGWVIPLEKVDEPK
jgi:hypothetical protein